MKPFDWNTCTDRKAANLATLVTDNSPKARLVAIKRVAIACGISPLSWTLDEANAFFYEGPPSSVAPAAPGAFDEDRVREIAREEAAKVKAAAPRAVVAGVAVLPAAGARQHKDAFDVLIFARTKHVLMVGPAGSGKTTLAKQVAAMMPNSAGGIGRPFYSTGSVQRESALLGFQYPSSDGTLHTVKTQFRMAFEFGGVFLFDEVDGSDANALVAFNQALANGECAFPDGLIKAHPDFVCLAGANTYGSGASRLYVGRNELDKAFLDRFAVQTIEYDEDMERELGADPEWTDIVLRVRRAVEELKVMMLVTPRATYDAPQIIADYVASGVPRKAAVEKCLHALIFKGAADDTIKAIRDKAGV